MRVHGGKGAKGMNELFQWFVHGEVKDINDSSSLHHNRQQQRGIGTQEEASQVYGQRYCSCSHGVVEDHTITGLWNTTKQGIGYTRLNGTSHFQLVKQSQIHS